MHAAVPMRNIGPVKIIGPVLQEEILVPLATFETPLWPSTNRGATISRLTAGIRSIVIADKMTRSVLVEGPNSQYILDVVTTLESHRQELAQVVSATSAFAKLQDWHVQIAGNLLYIRFEMTTGDASGHNMTTKASDALLEWILKHYSQLQYVSISGNFCTDKKVSAVNGILGRGKYVIAEITIPRPICERYLKTTPEKIVNLNIKKNLIGSILAGGVRSANAHFANMLLAFYLATGQDAANIIEGSQGIVHTEVRDQELYFSVTLPNVIVGTIGNGKDLPFARENLALLGCLNQKEPGQNTIRLACIVGATVLCGELSLLAAQTNQGELMHSHLQLERSNLSQAE
ncbi:Hydroxymethylglutaryl-CoA reductase [Candidatus Trichorickettsia mobilis]|uniref:Hydroxymethylglutaryl-CoA reductase n=1 Tax=Candidatus Trichorickettsia mobilis TaxID=1346319 RepID=A0ABZ0UZ40_9RICK|nr:Hydroxymethylglutaryl-CoA reductase [Candidatus Trichorickettsia mobilis]